MIGANGQTTVARNRLQALGSQIDPYDHAHAGHATKRAVNFFGHAAVASWSDPAAGRAMGAMLPDFATMCRSRLGEPSDAMVASGVALHHATDAAFHRLAPVTALMRELDDRLAFLGCARGPRRAVAHIGVELMLDGVLVSEAGYRACYLAGLDHGNRGVRWVDTEGPRYFEFLLERLRRHGVPDDLQRIESIAQRLQRILGHRPLLAPSPADMAAIVVAMREQRPRIEIAAETVMRALRAAMESAATASD